MASISSANRPLLIYGAALFLIGLLNGAAIPAFENSRMGLSAHMAGVQNGMVLLIFGLLWGYVALPRALEKVARWSNIAGMYGVWVGLLLAAIWGTSRSTPIAGEGYVGEAWQENLVQVVITAASVAAILGAALLLLGLIRGRKVPAP